MSLSLHDDTEKSMYKKDIKFLNNNQFAISIGVSRGAIGQAIGERRVHKERWGIDPNHPINIAYEQNLPPNDKVQAARAKRLAEIQENHGVQSHSQPQSTPPPQYQPPARETEPKYTQADHKIFLDEKKLKNEMEKMKLMNQQMKIAKEEKQFIPFKWVGQLMNLINSGIQSYFMTLDEKLTAKIMAICEIQDKEKELKVKELIAKTTEIGLQQMTKRAKRLEFIKSSEFKGEIY